MVFIWSDNVIRKQEMEAKRRKEEEERRKQDEIDRKNAVRYIWSLSAFGTDNIFS